MLQKTLRRSYGGLLFFLTLLLLVSLWPARPQAAGDVYESHIELSGTFDRTFTLSPSDLTFFHLENVVPGDKWNGKITVTNKTEDKMEIALLSINNHLKDTTLYDALDLDISLSGETIYSGSYGATEEPISAFYAISPGRSLTFDVTVTLPKEVGNEIQDKEMDSTWTFEGRYYGNQAAGAAEEVSYSIDYVDENGYHLLDSKVGKGQIGETLTVRAPEIEGYKADQNEKSLTLGKNHNKLVFIYKAIASDEAMIPANGGNEKKTFDYPTPTQQSGQSESVQTGVDQTKSNISDTTWLILAVICVVGIVVLILRIKETRLRSEERNYQKKGRNDHVED